MHQPLNINPAQYEILNLLSCVNSKEDMKELKSVLVQFLNNRMQKEIDSLWDEGMVNEETIEQWGDEHMRTPYKH